MQLTGLGTVALIHKNKQITLGLKVFRNGAGDLLNKGVCGFF